jgi:hypothetical protein
MYSDKKPYSLKKHFRKSFFRVFYFKGSHSQRIYVVVGFVKKKDFDSHKLL